MEYKNNQDLIDLQSILKIFWSRKYFIASITFFGAVLSIIYALSLNNVYKSSSILKPSESYLVQGNSSLSSLVSQSPLNLLTGSSDLDDKLSFSLEKIKNLDFFKLLYEKDNFLVELYAAKSWSPDTGELNLDKNIYDISKNQWTRKVSRGSPKPSIQEAHRLFMTTKFSLSVDEKTNFVTMSVNHISPHVAQNWNDYIVEKINIEIKEHDLSKTKNELLFLQNNIYTPEFLGIRDSLSYLMTQKINKLALIESSPNYVFEYVQKAYVPERKFGPSRSLICIAITLGSFILAIVLSSFLNTYTVNLRDILRQIGRKK